MPTLKKSIKAVRDALKEAEKQQVRILMGITVCQGIDPHDHAHGKLDGLKLAQRIINQVFPQ